MPRAIDGTRRKNRRKKILKQAKGYWGRRSKLFRTAKDAVARLVTLPVTEVVSVCLSYWKCARI